MTKANTKSRNVKAITTTRVFPIVLKTIINDAMNEKTIVDDNAKRIRAKIRANKNAIETTQHVHNTSHVAHNQSQYDALRCSFDNVYASQLNDAIERARIERANARKAKTKTRVSLAKTNDDASRDDDANDDA